MCGIAGFSGTQNVPKDKLKILMLYARNRGSDAAGYGYIRDKLFYEFKSASDPRKFISMIPKGRTHNVPDVKAIIGHTRAASYMTKKNDDCAHPFAFQNLVGAHNGALTNDDGIKDKYQMPDYGVDSRALFHLISEIGFEEALKEMYGSMALCWITEGNVLNLYRHNNPIWIGYDGDDMWFASLPHYLRAIGIKKPESLQEHVHYQFVDGKLIQEKEIKHTPTYSSSKPSEYVRKKTQAPFKEDNVKVKVRDIHTPESAPEESIMVFDEGKMMRYWFPDDSDLVVSVESILSFGTTRVESFDLDKHDEMKEFSVKYPKIANELCK